MKASFFSIIVLATAVLTVSALPILNSEVPSSLRSLSAPGPVSSSLQVTESVIHLDAYSYKNSVLAGSDSVEPLDDPEAYLYPHQDYGSSLTESFAIEDGACIDTNKLGFVVSRRWAFIRFSVSLSDVVLIDHGALSAGVRVTISGLGRNIPTDLSAVSYTARSAAIVNDLLVLVLTWIKTSNVWRDTWKNGGTKPTLTMLVLRNGTVYFGLGSPMLDIYSTDFNEATAFLFVLTSVTANLIARFILDLRTVYTDGHAIANHPSVSNLRFGTNSLAGNMGAPLGIESSTWLSGASDDTVDEQDESTKHQLPAGMGEGLQHIPLVAINHRRVPSRAGWSDTTLQDASVASYASTGKHA
ncbi:hypothetical protein EIP91_003324 [Steccherinum ochraceum]|uniref:Uncharacterized protein n=1 Tax=Steccherinum ochraceum TaxID=92696 RepID=A0A4R0RH39_9APHY|nr:hypothetical protein EIP91_003324 [Steccherinum ochraceum]